MLRLAVLLCLVTGCVEVVDLRIHRDRPTPVRLDPGVSAATLAEASNVWRILGPSFVEQEPAALVIRRGELPWPTVGFYSFDADIERQVVTLQNDDAGVLAHELGHALGLLHVAQEPCALMSPDLCTTELTAWDLVEWERTAL